MGRKNKKNGINIIFNIKMIEVRGEGKDIKKINNNKNKKSIP